MTRIIHPPTVGPGTHQTEYRPVHIVQIAEHCDRYGNLLQTILYCDGRVFKKTNDAPWRKMEEPEEIVKEREARDKELREHAHKAGVMFAGKPRDYSEGVPLPLLDYLMSEEECK